MKKSEPLSPVRKSRLLCEAIMGNDLDKVDQWLRDPGLGQFIDIAFNNNPPLHWALYSGQPGIARKLLAAGAAVNTQGMNDNTPLHLAALRTDKDIMQQLLKKGADVTARNGYGEIPLHNAVGAGIADNIRCLVDRNPETVNAPDDHGNTPLHHAVHHHAEKAVEVLLEKGADPTLRNDQEIKPVDIAGNNWAIKRLLRDAEQRSPSSGIA